MIDMVFFTSPIGLGHATRDAAISCHMEGLSKKYVTGAGAYKLFSEYGFDSEDLYHPPPFKIENGKLQSPLRWLLTYLPYYRETKRISAGIIARDGPRLVVSDEDFGSLASAQKGKVRSVLVTDILETRFAKGAGAVVERLMNRGMKDIISKCDLVIVPEDGQGSGNIARVGPIVREPSGTRDEMRRKYGFGKKTVIVSTGGTDLGRFLFEKAIEVFDRGNIDADLVLVSGPSLQMPETRYRNLGFASNMHEIVLAADVVISLAGKSTIDECVHFGTPGIFIPIKGHFEQEENAGDAGYSFDDLPRLEELVLKKLEERRDPRPFGGAKAAADMIRKLV